MDISSTLSLPDGNKMPQFGLGTWQMKAVEEAKLAAGAAIDGGYRLLDTAFLYQNEAFLGEVLQERFKAGTLKREDVFITTKLAPIHMSTPELVRHGVEESLKRLNLDYIDLYLIHAPVPFKYISDDNLFPLKDGRMETMEHDLVKIWQVLESFVDEGKVKSLGVSNFNITQISRVMAAAKHPVCNLQVELNVYHQQESLVEYCRKNKISVTAYAPLGSPGYEDKKGPNLLEDETVAKIAKNYNKTAAQVAMRFLLQLGVAIIPKSANPGRITENSQSKSPSRVPIQRRTMKT